MSRSSLSRTALVGFITFPLVVLVLHFAEWGQDQDRPLREAVSELALGRAGGLMAIAFCAMAVGTLAFARLVKETTGARVAPVLLTIAGLLTFVSAFVHADGPHASTTTHGTIHQAAGVVSFLSLIAVMLTVVRPFRREASWARLAGPTRACAIAAVVCFLLIPLSGSALFGLAQRGFLAVCIGWLIAAAIHARRAEPAINPAVQIPGNPNGETHDQQAGLRGYSIAGRG